MDFVKNSVRCLFTGIKRRRRKILVYVLTIVTLWHLYLACTGLILSSHIQVVREPETLIRANLKFSRLRERIFGNDPKNKLEAKPYEYPNYTDESVKLYSETLEHGDAASHGDNKQRFSDSNSERNTTSTENMKSSCKEFNLPDADKNSYGTCQPHQASLDACEFADSLFPYDSSLSLCKTNNAEICTLETDAHSGKIILNAKCSGQVCEEYVNKSEEENSLTYGAYIIDPDEGFLESIREFETVSELETQLPRIAYLTARKKLNFLFVKCFIMSRNESLVSQLIPVPLLVTIQEASEPRHRNNINVNIVLLDSVSRAHFYRSLPKTIETFRKLSGSRDKTPARVFDFELFQSVHGHTTQNEHALFTGQLLPSKEEDEQEPSDPVRADVMLGHFKRAGYQTMWQEDLCWTGIWGLMADLAAEDWEDLQIRLKENFIDSTGLTHSSCEVLGSFGLETPFNGPEGDQICFNGKLQHSYFLEYSIDMLNIIASSRRYRPLFSYTALNVGHDETGRRIQSLDSDLARFVSVMANNKNTLSIVLADHGNTYTQYTSDVLEGRFEMFHPSLFVIVPNKVAELLGPVAMAALEVNQRRLVTMFNLHHSLLPLARPLRGVVKPIGLFTAISPNLTCNDIELRTPNLCVCNGWDSPTTNDSSKISFAEFAVGELNEMLQAEFTEPINGKLQKHPMIRSCERLRPVRFQNVRERNSKSDGELITSFDIYFRSGDVVKQKEDIFHVEVKSKEMANQYSLQMELVNYDRLTLFGKYQACADQGAHLKLCICSRRTKKRLTELERVPWLEYSTILSNSPKARKVGDDQCLFLLKRNHSLGQSVAFEIANICNEKIFYLRISANFENMKLSRKVPFEVKVQPGSIKFLLSARIAVDFWSTFIEVDVDINEKGVSYPPS
ncbi:uncharacterized protein LOC111329989 [Stylophora pistillata]|uniref:uncharacterized protein LOC111329989 n=1 Tax=Stylophora pistillata TaxID=50429 RepID=UPI000C04D377|nr:uncharacterized protein LOC111329989 [Stylophora pistillata]